MIQILNYLIRTVKQGFKKLVFLKHKQLTKDTIPPDLSPSLKVIYRSNDILEDFDDEFIPVFKL